ncbi:MAG TPA: hypothetical protein PLV21_18380 [Cyclobacteriaceae bacterium]|nr:hypothetical protein [Cyclobacteriaceae bacterium]HRJ83859.1 hypothetical protein [Cyclobacteriaceae bacterium]
MMTPESLDWNMLAKWLFDECTADEQNEINAYLRTKPKVFNEIIEIQKGLLKTNYYPNQEEVLLNQIKNTLFR